MKRGLIKATLCLLALPAFVSIARTQTEPPATVLSFDWKYAGYARSETVKEFETLANRGSSPSYKVARSVIYVFKYAAKATLKNTSAKAIKAVSWDYIFTDKESGKEIKRFRIQSKQGIQPGEVATLVREIGIDPKEDTRPLNGSKQSVEVTRIEYTDGSLWHR